MTGFKERLLKLNTFQKIVLISTALIILAFSVTCSAVTSGKGILFSDSHSSL